MAKLLVAPHNAFNHKPYTTVQVTLKSEELILIIGQPRKQDKRLIWWPQLTSSDLIDKFGFEEPFPGIFAGPDWSKEPRISASKMGYESCDVKYLKENNLAEFKFRTFMGFMI